MAYSKKITAKKGSIETLSVFIVIALSELIPGLKGLEQAGLVAVVSGLIVSAINYFKHK